MSEAPSPYQVLSEAFRWARETGQRWGTLERREEFRIDRTVAALHWPIPAGRVRQALEVRYPTDRIVMPSQRGGLNVVNATFNHETSIPNAQGLIARWTGEQDRNLRLGALAADCTIIAMEGRQVVTGASVIGLFHAGWRETLAKVDVACFEEFQRENVDRESIRLTVLPSIRRCCFEVDHDGTTDLARQFVNAFGSSVVERRDGRVFVDLVAAHQVLLCEQLKLDEKQITVDPRCTYCTVEDMETQKVPVFPSHRRAIHQGKSSAGAYLVATVGFGGNGDRRAA